MSAHRPSQVLARLAAQELGVDAHNIDELDVEAAKAKLAASAVLNNRLFSRLLSQSDSTAEGVASAAVEELAARLHPVSCGALTTRDVSVETRRLGSVIAVAYWSKFAVYRTTTTASIDAQAWRDTIEGLVARTGISRLRCERPVELALIVPPVVVVSMTALTLLIYAIRRLYGLDLELRTNCANLRASFYEAQQGARDAHRAALSSRDPASWPPGMMSAVCDVIDTVATEVSQLHSDAVVLVDERDHDVVSRA